ncbi:MAG TPA: carboxypeptidase-like regulatory domain-containing protein [Sphingobacteriaceae bacterium]
MKANRPDISLIRKYLDGELDERAMYELERQAENDPQLMDVIKGMESADAETHNNNLVSIDRLLHERINKGKRRNSFLWANWQVAASLLIALTVGTWWLTQKPEKEKITKRPARVERKDTLVLPVPKNEKPVGSAIAKSQQKQPSVIHKSDLERELKKSLSVASNDKQYSQKENPSLNEVVVVAYGTQKKSNVVGSVTTSTPEFDSKKLLDSNINEALSGKASGVTVLRGQSGNTANMVISGKVVDKTDNSPLPGAAIRVNGTPYATVTDVNGNFSINIPENTKVLDIAYLGYDPKEVKVKKGENLEVKMDLNSAALSEVVVVGYNSDKSSSEEAQPVIGWRAYKDYLKENAVSPDSGTYRAIVEFTVDRSGRTSNFNVKGSNDVLNQKAIDLIVNGPKWIGGKGEKPQTVKLRITFHK